ncbi:hypothetical protein HWV07_12280 [Natronomonas salina]|uniref:Zn-ribbon domain-containing protein n=1 Tax=Natronomonas salina TaxID=1710540 RepID=UPI0015B70CD7|nr:Zn-ribbon containing protein [Natronomonas salina]QLD89762.1 hypothetical protein HWV07_12280 [Natronomonas salina]
MPHQCTGCGHTFADGSKEMLSGCPECGGNKFQFRPEGASLPDDPSETDSGAAQSGPDSQEPSPDAEPPEPDGSSSSVAETVGRATTKVRDFVSSDPAEIDSPDPEASWPSEREEAAGSGASGTADPSPDPSPSSGTDDDIIDADARREAVETDEDDAQASARSDVVSDEELDGADAVEGRDPLAGDAAGGLAGSGGEVVSEPSEADPDIAELREQLNDQFESIKIVEPGQYELNLMELYDREEYIIALQENGRYVIQVPEQWIGDQPGDS